MGKDDLDSNLTDFGVSLLKITGSVAFIWAPTVSDAFNEIIGLLIPNQRADRMAKAIRTINSKIALIPAEVFNEMKKDPRFLDFIQEGIMQISRAASEKKVEYISLIIANGLTEEEISYEQSNTLLKLIEELEMLEIMWLRYYLIPEGLGDHEFKEAHKDIFHIKPLARDHSESEALRVNFRDRYKLRLEQMHLIKKVKMPSYSHRPGVMQPKDTPRTIRITELGKRLLKQIGFENPNEE